MGLSPMAARRDGSRFEGTSCASTPCSTASSGAAGLTTTGGGKGIVVVVSTGGATVVTADT